MSPDLARALVTILFGALAGGLTNQVAVWMLFHPYEPPRIGPFRLAFLHGAIPKNQDRLAGAVGRVVGDRLLTHEDLTRILTNTEFRDTFDRELGTFLREILERERGSLREVLGPEIAGEVAALLDEVASHLAGRLNEWLDSNAFEAAVSSRLEEWRERVADRSVDEFLTEERGEALAGFVGDWLAHAVERKSFEQAVDGYVERTFDRVLRDDRSLQEILPSGLVASLERAVGGYLPIAVRRLGGILEDPEARRRLQVVLERLFERLMQDLRFHQRLVARLVVTEDTIERALGTIEEEGAEHLSELLKDSAVQEAMTARVNEAVGDLLARPVTAVLGRPGDESVVRARRTISGWILTMARDPDGRGVLVEKLREGMGRAATRTWGDLLSGIPSERISGAIVSSARSDVARRAYREVLGRMIAGVLDRPIGRPADLLPTGSTDRIRRALAEPLWTWIRSQSPHVVRLLDVGRRVEEKVRAYPTAKIEELVRRVTDRELTLIVRLGYVLGGAIGAVMVLVDAWL